MASTITPYGLGKIAAAAQNGTALNVTSIAIGDGTATTTGIGGTNVYNITSGITTSVDNTDPAHPMIKVQGTIPSSIPGEFTIGSIALMDDANVIAVADGSFDTMHGSESPTPQAYSVTFLLPLSNAANFSVIQSVGGDYLPLAGGTMDEGAEIELVNRDGYTSLIDRSVNISADGVSVTAPAFVSGSGGMFGGGVEVDTTGITFRTFGQNPTTYVEGEVRLSMRVEHPGGGSNADVNLRVPRFYASRRERTRATASGSVWSDWSDWVDVLLT
jgi:hypothetical protein